MSDHEPLDRFAANLDWGIMGIFLVWFNNSLSGKTYFLDKGIISYKAVIFSLGWVWVG